MKKVLSSVILSLLLSFSNAKAEILYNLENPEFGSPASGIGMISLWAFSTTPGAIVEVDVEVDGMFTLPLLCGVERADVKNFYPQYTNALNSGCAIQVNWGNAPPGIHSLVWQMRSSIGESRNETRLVTTVRFGDARFVDNFDLSEATSFIDKSTNEVVLTNVKVHNAETGEWTTTELRFQFIVSSQGLQLSSAIITGGDENVSYVFDPGADYQEIKDYVVQSLAYLKREAGGSPTDFTVFAFVDLDKLVDAYMSFFKMSSDQRERIKSHWQNAIGESGYDYVFIYLGGHWLSSPSKLGVIAHELTHIQQAQLTGNPGLNGRPVWLTEGVAGVAQFGIQGIKPQPGRPSWLDQCGAATLQSMETHEVEGCPLGLLATNFMGLPLNELMGFWEKIRTEGDWKKAFAAHFGRTVEEFYTSFEQYRATL